MHKQYVSRKRRYRNEEQTTQTEPKSKPKASDSDSDSGDEEDYDVYRRGTAVYFNVRISVQSIAKLRRILDEACQCAMKNSNTLQRPQVALYIHSPGGDVFAGFSGYHMIKRSPVTITTIADGHVASAATFLLLAGKMRYIVPGSHVLIHQLSTVAFGKFDEISDEYKNCQNIMARMSEMYKSETSLSDKKLKKLLKGELDLTDAECLNYNIVSDFLPAYN